MHAVWMYLLGERERKEGKGKEENSFSREELSRVCVFCVFVKCGCFFFYKCGLLSLFFFTNCSNKYVCPTSIVSFCVHAYMHPYLVLLPPCAWACVPSSPHATACRPPLPFHWTSNRQTQTHVMDFDFPIQALCIHIKPHTSTHTHTQIRTLSGGRYRTGHVSLLPPILPPSPDH